MLGADGIKGKVGTGLLKKLNSTTAIVDSGQAAYMIMLMREQMGTAPLAKELLALLDSETLTRWIGLRKHIIRFTTYRLHNRVPTSPSRQKKPTPPMAPKKTGWRYTQTPIATAYLGGRVGGTGK